MSLALLDTPRCVAGESVYVGPPRVLFDARKIRTRPWLDGAEADDTASWRESALMQCFNTAAVLRSYREPMAGETWRTPAASERRLLAQINALLALGTAALARVAELALDPDLPDPGHVFAALLTLGCVDGVSWLARAKDIFVTALTRDPVEAGAAIEAFSLAANPCLGPLVEPLLDHEDARVRAGALRVLGFRGALAESRWQTALGDDDPAVVMAALCAPLRNYDRVACERLLLPMLQQSDPRTTTRAALRAAVSLRLGQAHSVAARIVRSGNPGWAGAMHCLAMFGHADDASLIRDVLHRSDPQTGVQAAGVLGRLELMPDLLRLLGRYDAPSAEADQLYEALNMITGLPFSPSAGPEEARQLWARSYARFESFDPRLRYRHGEPLTLTALLQSLLADTGSRERRQDAYLEMLSATHSRVPRFSPYDFVGVQHESLRRIGQWMADLPRESAHVPTSRS